MPDDSINDSWFKRFCEHLRSVFRRDDLGTAAKLIYWLLADHAGKNDTCYPSVRILAKESDLDVKTVIRGIAELESAKLVNVERPTGNPARQHNVYTLPERPVFSNAGKSPTLASDDGERSLFGMGALAKREHNETHKRDSGNETHKRGAQADPWQLAQDAMTGAALRTDQFRAAWLSWVKYRREAHKPLAASTVRAQIKKLEEFGHDAAISSIERSISNGWAGLFPADSGARGNGEHRTRRFGTNEDVKPRILN